MKKFTLSVLLLGIAISGFPQFVAMPLDYPWDTSAYLSYWVSIVDQNTVWVGTAHQRNQGYIAYSKAVRTTDGGNSWQFYNIPVPGNPWIQHLSAWDENICYYLFTDGTTYGGAVWKTTNGGASWLQKTTTQFSGGWANVIHCFSADTVMAMGDPTGGYFEIQLTFDGGNNWTRVSASDIPATLDGETGTSGEYCTVGNSIWFPTSKGRCFRSSDKGLHWNVSSVANGYIRISFSDSQNGIAFLPGVSTGYYKSSDGGSSWTLHPGSISAFLYGSASRVPGIDNGYVVTSYDTATTSVYFTPDAFNTFIKIDSNIHNSSFIYFKDASTGWLGGSYNPIHNIHKYFGVLTSIKEVNNYKENMQIFPNPSSGEALVKVPQNRFSVKTIVRITDMTGKTISESDYDTRSGWIKLNADGYKSGLYLVELVSEDGNGTSQRWIVQH
ncbi:MAG: T9SS type A sorting domain-containing protein [Bacteroidota bacterium]